MKFNNIVYIAAILCVVFACTLTNAQLSANAFFENTTPKSKSNFKLLVFPTGQNPIIFAKDTEAQVVVSFPEDYSVQLTRDDMAKVKCNFRFNGVSIPTSSVGIVNQNEEGPFTIDARFNVGAKAITVDNANTHLYLLCTNIPNGDNVSADNDVIKGEVSVYPQVDSQPRIDVVIFEKISQEPQVTWATFSLHFTLPSTAEASTSIALVSPDAANDAITKLGNGLIILGLKLDLLRVLSSEIDTTENTATVNYVFNVISTSGETYVVEPAIFGGLFASYKQQLLGVYGGDNKLIEGYNLVDAEVESFRFNTSCIEQNEIECKKSPTDRDVCFPCLSGKCSSDEDCAYQCVDVNSDGTEKECNTSSMVGPFGALALATVFILAFIF